MREIKFRGRSKLTGKWAYGYYSVRASEHFISFMNNNHQWQDVEVIPKTVGQFTNLPDKNGKEIYEGDIIRWHNFYPEPEDYFVVKWLDFRGAYSLFRQNHFMSHLPYADLHEMNKKNYEVIGNIYENPELLEVKV